jgi:CDP-diacylglycerol--glycerol-3-phosphate 3-phosphatidyltransferase
MKMNLPNRITIFRVCMIPFFVAVMLLDSIPYNNYIAFAIFAIASASDALDGYIARSRNLVTNFGKFMDPIADKLLVSSAFILFVELNRVPGYVVIILIAREFIISGFRLVASDNGVVIAAGYAGKIKTVCQMIMCLLVILHLDFYAFRVAEIIFIVLSTLFSVISMIEYIVKNKAVLNN